MGCCGTESAIQLIFWLQLGPFSVDHSIKRRAIPWIGLCAILILYVIAVFQFNPADLFGKTQDDSIYFASAKALANHQGYVLPSVPGQPVATKYPVLFPWILSWVWRWNPSFPANLTGAIAIIVAFGVLFIVSCFVYLRRIKRIGDWIALLLTFFVALHPVFLFYSASVLSDVPFSALALAAMLVADEAMKPEGGEVKAVSCALLTGLSVLMRVFGLTVAAGILVAAISRRAWRQSVIFCAVLVPFALGLAWRLVHAPSQFAAALGSVPREPGFMRAWIYYTSYAGFWKLSVPNLRMLWAMLKNNAAIVLLSPSDFFLAPLFKSDHIASLFLMLLVTFGIFAGLVRQWREQPWKSVPCVFAFYVALTMMWNYPNTGRFFFLFLPFFAAGLWDETSHFLALLYSSAGNEPGRREKAIIGVFAVAVLALLFGGAWNYVRGARKMMADLVSDRSQILEEKREAYNWLSCCTSRQDRVVSYEDVCLYLYSGKQGMRPLIFPTSAEFDETYSREALDQMMDVARAINARYWVIADDDFEMEWDPVNIIGRAREAEFARKLPLVFQSSNGHIRIYKIGCDAHSNSHPCP